MRKSCLPVSTVALLRNDASAERGDNSTIVGCILLPHESTTDRTHSMVGVMARPVSPIH